MQEPGLQRPWAVGVLRLFPPVPLEQAGAWGAGGGAGHLCPFLTEVFIHSEAQGKPVGGSAVPLALPDAPTPVWNVGLAEKMGPWGLMLPPSTGAPGRRPAQPLRQAPGS